MYWVFYQVVTVIPSGTILLTLKLIGLFLQFQDRKHVDLLTLSLELDGKERVFDLRLNRDLLPERFKRRYQHLGGMKEYNPGKVVRLNIHSFLLQFWVQFYHFISQNKIIKINNKLIYTIWLENIIISLFSISNIIISFNFFSLDPSLSNIWCKVCSINRSLNPY